MKILEVVKDPGGIQAVRPIGDELIKMGHTVHRLANGAALKILPSSELEHVAVESAEDAIKKFGAPDLLLTSMCSEGGVGRDLVPLLRHRCPTVAVQDQWGGRLATDWADPRYRPDHLVVNDEVAADIVHRAWPGYPDHRVQQLGYAALDALYEFDAAAARHKTRTLLDVGNSPLIYFSGHLLGGGASLEAFLSALTGINYDGAVLLAKHPRMVDTDPALAEDARQWKEAVAAYEGRIIPVPHPQPVELDRIASADVVVSMYSTALMHAAALRKPAISILFEGSAMQEAYAATTGGLMRRYPLAELGCVAGPETQRQLQGALGFALEGTLQKHLQSAQEKWIKVDGKNAARIAEFVSTLA